MDSNLIFQWASIVALPIFTMILDHVLKNNTRRQEQMQKEADEKREQAREESRQHREALDKKIDEIHRNVCLNNESSKSTMRYMLQRRHAEYMMQNYVTSLQLDEFNRDFKVYEAQGGNGTAKKWHEEVNDLKVDDTKHPKNIYLEMLKEKHNL